MKTIQIPATVEEAASELNGIHELLTAKGWAKAALVAAFTEKKAGNKSGNPDLLSFRSFCELGINGLRDQGTVAYYAAAWEGTGLPSPVPGKPCQLPMDPWPPASEFNGRDYDDERMAAVANDEAKLTALVEKATASLGADVVAAAIVDANSGVGDAVEAVVIDNRVRSVSDETKDLADAIKDVAEDATGAWDLADTGTSDPDGAWIRRMANEVNYRSMLNDSEEFTDALSHLIGVAETIRNARINKSEPKFSKDDLSFLAEAGVQA